MKNMNETLLVITNLPDSESASKLALELVETHAAACVNQLAPCVSTYRWNGKTETASEIPLLIKTTKSAYPGLEKLICKSHPYELPEIIAVSVTAGLPGYLDWIASETSVIKE